MIGMIQILTYLLAVYLVYKGIEIFQIALVSTSPKRDAVLVIGSIALVVAVGCAIFFVNWADTQAASVSTSFPH